MIFWPAVLATAAGMARAPAAGMARAPAGAAGRGGTGAACLAGVAAALAAGTGAADLAAGALDLATSAARAVCACTARLVAGALTGGAACFCFTGAGFRASLAWTFTAPLLRLGLAALAVGMGCAALRLAGFLLTFFALLEAILCAMSLSLYIRVQTRNRPVPPSCNR